MKRSNRSYKSFKKRGRKKRRPSKYYRVSRGGTQL
jgi:hypothetical protein